MASVESALVADGRVEVPLSGKPFQTDNVELVWIVLSGKVDLFLSHAFGDSTGARHHLWRIEESNAIFGMPRLPGPMQMMAVATPGTEILVAPHVRLRQMVSEGVPEAVVLLERWIENITAAACQTLAPVPATVIQPGYILNTGTLARTIVPQKELVWVSHSSGYSRLLGCDDLPLIEGRMCFPVSRFGWLSTLEHSRVRIVSTRTVPKLDPDWHGLRQFERLLTDRIARFGKAIESRGQAQIETRLTADAALVRKSMELLSSPLEQRQPIVAEDDTCRDPIFLACQVIGRYLFINIRPHPDMRRGRIIADPVAAVARSSNIRVRRVTLDGRWWKGQYGPFLVFREEDKRPLALIPAPRGRYNVHDPQTLETHPLTKTMAQSISPSACILYRPFHKKQVRVLDLLNFGFRGCRVELNTICVCGLATGLLGLMAPLITAVVFDQLIPGAERQQLFQISIFLLVIALASAMVTFARDFTILKLQGKVDAALQSAMWDRLLSLPMSFFRQYTSGDLAQRSMGISRIREILAGHAISAVLSGVFSIFSYLLLFIYSWQLAILATALVTFAVLVTGICGGIQLRYQRTTCTLQNKISSKLLQFISGVVKFRVSGCETRAFASWVREFSLQKQAATATRRVSNVMAVFGAVFPVISLASIFWAYGSLVSSKSGDGLSTGHFLAFVAAFTQFLTGVLSVTSTVIAVIGIIPVYEQAKPIFLSAPEVGDAAADPGALRGEIDISHITFRYKPELPPILRDFDVRIQPGEFIALVGPSGSGKSTLFRLLLGFEAPESGAIYYDGQDLSGLDVQAVRRQIGVVLQSSRLFAGSIFSNIVGSGPYTITEAQEAARLAGLESDVAQMPMGLHTMLADGGAGISGGQRQRLLIARAIIGRPRILLFDEATSALDNRTQEIVSRSLERLEATRIVIAHRLSTVMNADCILVFDKGSVVQRGTYKELLQERGLFQDLVRRQIA